MQETIRQLGDLLLSSLPTLFLFIVLVLAYQFLVQGPLSRTLKERRARTAGAVEEANKAIAAAEAKTADYAARLRQARAEVLPRTRTASAAVGAGAGFRARRGAQVGAPAGARRQSWLGGRSGLSSQGVAGRNRSIGRTGDTCRVAGDRRGFPLIFRKLSLRNAAGLILLTALILGIVLLPPVLPAQAADSTSPAQAQPEASRPASPFRNAHKEVKKSEAEETEEYRHSASVQALAKLLHVDVETAATGFEYINFAVILLAIGIPLFRILPKAMRERSEKLNKDLETARTATADANSR